MDVSRQAELRNERRVEYGKSTREEVTKTGERKDVEMQRAEMQMEMEIYFVLVPERKRSSITMDGTHSNTLKSSKLQKDSSTPMYPFSRPSLDLACFFGISDERSPYRLER